LNSPKEQFLIFGTDGNPVLNPENTLSAGESPIRAPSMFVYGYSNMGRMKKNYIRRFDAIDDRFCIKLSFKHSNCCR